MTIMRDDGIFAVECNGCGDCHDLKAETMAEAIAEVRDAGWQPVKAEDGSWEHKCHDCQKAERRWERGEE